MKDLRKNSFISTLAAIIFLGSLPVVATAEITTPEVAPEAAAEMTEEAAKVLQAKDDMTKALNIAAERVDARKSELEKLSFPEASREAELKASLLQELDGYKAYYLRKREALASLTSLEEIKALAQEIKTYREEIYAPEGQRIVAFISLYANESDLGVTKERFEKIKTDLDNLKGLGLIDETVTLDEVSLIDGLLQESANSQNEARELILGGSSNDSARANGLIQETMARIKTTYDLYLSLSGTVNSKLGIGK
ncbi:MAG: hypothetical protein HYS89_01220 [Candidatus Colwellbacteria bacterium]|nr:hypothetical protein [Candidatus Colwellbacteria bacterium]